MADEIAAATAAQVHPSNLAQAQAWDGAEGDHWAAHAERFERSVAAYDADFLDAAQIGVRSTVLDVGCGTGATTRAVARLAPAGRALGVDLSRRMIEVARSRTQQAGLVNARFLQADAQVYPFAPASFDVVLSRTGAMFFGDPQAAFGNLARSTRPGGRLVLLVWQSLASNEWMRAIRTALAAGRTLPDPPPDAPGPFSMSDPDRVRATLRLAGFDEIGITGVERPMCFGDDADGAYALVAGLTSWMLGGLDEPGRARALRNLRATVDAHVTRHGVLFGSATWLISARRA